MLKLQKTLYGLKQGLWMFWKHLTEAMEDCDMKFSKLNPCLFVGDNVMIFYSGQIMKKTSMTLL